MKFGQDYHATITSVATCKEMLISGVGVTILPEIMMKNIDHHVFEFEKVNIGSSVNPLNVYEL